MTQPRPVLPGRTYMMTRRCSERRFLLKPCKEVEQAFLYCFGVALERYGLDVYWLEVMSNHYHDGVNDPDGKYPRLLKYFHSLLTRCLNVHWGRWESLWSTEQSGALQLGDAEAVFDKMIYSLTNPVKDHLVDKAVHWPGFSSLRYQLSGKPVLAKRPKWFFDPEGEMPEQVELTFRRPPAFAHLTHDEWVAKIRAAVAEQERKAADERRRTGRKVVGRKAILRQSPYSCPKSFAKRRGLRPQVATRNKWLRRELLAANKEFQQRYREALNKRRESGRAVVFPAGTYQLVELGLVRCAPPPALE